MTDTTQKVGAYFQADNGDWFEIKVSQQPDRLRRAASFTKVLSGAHDPIKTDTFLLGDGGAVDRSGRFGCMDGICEMGGEAERDRPGRFGCMDGVCEMGSTGSADRTGRFSCMDGICEV